MRANGWLLCLLTASLGAYNSTYADNVWVSRAIDLQYAAAAVRVDGTRGLVYISLPDANAVAVVDVVSGTVNSPLTVGNRPEGIDLSSDGDTLYSALSGEGALGIYDLVNNTANSLTIATQLNATNPWDVAETAPGIVFISGIDGASYIVRADVAAKTAVVVASNMIIGGAPRFGKDPNGQVLYVGQGYSPNALYKLDITQPLAPVTQSAPFGEVIGVYLSIAANPAGDKLVAGYGMVVRAGEMTPDGYVGPGVSLYSSDGLLINDAYDNYPLTVHRFDSRTLDEVDSISTVCDVPFDGFPSPPTGIAALPNDTGWAVIEGSILCIVRQVPDVIFSGNFE